MSIGIRSAIRWTTNGKSFEAFVSALERLQHKTNLLRVLTYHRVDELNAHPDRSPRALSATPDGFAKQMQFLAENYRVLSLNELIEARRGGHPLPSRAVAITFDDAYDDFAKHAWPILERYDLPATVFVPTAYPDHPDRQFWWDRLYHAVFAATAATHHIEPFGEFTLGTQSQREATYRRMSNCVESLRHNAACELVDRVCDLLAAPKVPGSVLSWNDLRALAGSKVTLAPHTRTHPLLNRMDTRQAGEEILGSFDDLEREIGETPKIFAYPGGALTSKIVALLQAEGFELAFTTRRGINDWERSDPLRLNRINVGHRCPFGLWRGQLLGITRHLTHH